MHELVSIIVPVYNVAPYLERCLVSLTGQTYRRIEILLVDDGSTDASGTICDVWQDRDSRIQVFHKPNGGLSDARNYGLERASGDYVCFIDSDDWIDSQFIEVMLGTLLYADADIAECDYLCTDGSIPLPDSQQTAYDHELFEGEECFRRFLINDFFVSVCNKLYRRRILQNQQFRKGVYHEDEYWTYKIFSNAQKVCRLRYTGYYYYQRQGSIVHTAPSQKRLTDAFTAGKERVEFIVSRYPEYASIGYSKMMYTCMFLYNQARWSDFPQINTMQKELTAYFRLLFRQYLKKRKYQKEMWRFCFFFLFPNVYCKLNY